MSRSVGSFVGFVTVLTVFVILALVYRDSPFKGMLFERSCSSGVNEGEQKHANGSNGVAQNLEGKAEQGDTDVAKDKLLGGLLAAGFDEQSCLSRYQSVFYRKTTPRKPSTYLVDRLRKYEALHQRCAPNAKPFNEAMNQLNSGRTSTSADCKYVVWVSCSGLGNKILTIASAFLYALLTDRVLLLDRGTDMGDLFCEPFLNNTWLLPPGFSVDQFTSLPRRYGYMLKNNILNDSSGGVVPPFAYTHLTHDYDPYDKLFFCDKEQSLLQTIPWLFLRSNVYFVPSLFMMPMFYQELRSLFPEKESVFHHLGRYLFHPSNSAWGLITRFYRAYLANVEQSIGIQIRTFDGKGPFQNVLDMVVACTMNESLLPRVSFSKTIDYLQGIGNGSDSKVVLVTSLISWYSDEIRNMYWEYPTVTGEMVRVYQPSHEEIQQTEKEMHDMKAWAEMYLLSLTDVLVTSSKSTFGYVAQGLGGLKPWILAKPSQTVVDPPCFRAVSIEPCFHAPPHYNCKTRRVADTGSLVPHVKHCEDTSEGVKLVDNDEM